MSRLMHTFENLLDRLLAMIRPKRGRKRRRVTMRYLMLLSVAVSAVPWIELIFKPMA
jgi:hypothetical protein